MGKAIILSVIFFSSLGATFVCAAETAVIKKHIQNAKKTGEGRLHYLFWPIYDASLYSPNGIFSTDTPLALKLEYLRPLKGVRIAERSATEIKQQGFNDEQRLALWLDEMIDIFPDVEKGDSITGIKDKNGYAIFYLNNKPIGFIKDKELTKNFFAIWLGKNTSEPEMRKALLGL